MVLVLAVEYLLQKKLYLMLELLHNHVIVLGTQKMLKFSKNILVLSGIKLGVLLVLKLLK